MPIFNERNDTSILSAVTDPEGAPLFITEVNGDPALINTPIALSVGGTVRVLSNGTATFDDSSFSWPSQGQALNDGIIATVSDGQNTVPVSVNLQFNSL